MDLFFVLIALGIMFSVCRCSASNSSMFDICSTASSFCRGSEGKVQDIQFPFGAAAGCGHPDFQINCNSEHPSIIKINAHDYRIQQFSYSDQSIRIVDEAALSSYCYLPNASLDISGSQFQILQYSTLYFFIRCQKQVRNFSEINCTTNSYLAFSDDGIEANWSYYKNSSSCESVFKIPTKLLEATDYSTNLIPENYWTAAYGILREGFSVKWELDTSYESMCLLCSSNQGICGYNVSDPGHPFLCHCRNAFSKPESCFNGMAGISRSRRGKTFIMATGIVGSTVLVVAVLLVIAYRKKISSLSRQVLRRKRDKPQSISKVERFLHNYVDQMPTRYSCAVLKEITNNFAHKLGKGGFGVVYKGRLPGGNLVAVKMLDQSRESETQFMNEVATIGSIHHIHLIRLLGYCYEGLTSALVYEYMANGSLDKFILARKEEDQLLNWDQLYSIALGAARGIAYLHDECHKRIIHFDIKPHNILLDEDFTAKVADFGLAKLCGIRDEHVSMTAARGTPGYVAPEVWSRDWGPVTDKSDVYSFGMMLLEMVGGRKNIDIQASRSSQFYFPDWAIKLVERGELRTRLRERELGQADESKARSMAKVGVWCIQYNSTDPQMLEGDADDIPNPPTPFNARPRPAPFSGSDESSSIGIETAS